MHHFTWNSTFLFIYFYFLKQQCFHSWLHSSWHHYLKFVLYSSKLAQLCKKRLLNYGLRDIPPSTCWVLQTSSDSLLFWRICNKQSVELTQGMLFPVQTSESEIHHFPISWLSKEAPYHDTRVCKLVQTRLTHYSHPNDFRSHWMFSEQISSSRMSIFF